MIVETDTSIIDLLPTTEVVLVLEEIKARKAAEEEAKKLKNRIKAYFKKLLTKKEN